MPQSMPVINESLFDEQLVNFSENRLDNWDSLTGSEKSTVRVMACITGAWAGAFVSPGNDYDPLIGEMNAGGQRFVNLSENPRGQRSSQFDDKRYHDGAVITNLGDAKVILAGDRSDYKIIGSRGAMDGTAIFARTENGLDFVAAIQGQEPSDLRGQFVFRG